MTVELLYGTQRPDSVVHHLTAGPVRLKFQDGDLRYLKVGDREIVRRVYFALRDPAWDTVRNVIKNIEVDKQDDAFCIQMQMFCHKDAIEYPWTGRIEGTADGQIRFTVEGDSQSDFETPRTGLCVLFGAEALKGQSFSLTREDGSAKQGAFPELVKPTLVAEHFTALHYATPEGMEVTTALEGNLLTMEDQRNFGDSSWKAFTGYQRDAAQIKRGESFHQVVTITVKGAGATEDDGDESPLRISLPEAAGTARVPAIGTAEASRPDLEMFATANRGRDKVAGSEAVTFGYTPAAHQVDDDTLMENIPVIVDELRTLRSFIPEAVVRVDPIVIDAPYEHPDPDPRNQGLFAAAWCARMAKHLALAGVKEGVFMAGGKPAAVVLEQLAALEGQPLDPTGVGPHEAVDAFVAGSGEQRTMWLINKTGEPRDVEILAAADGGGGRRVQSLHAEADDVSRSRIDMNDPGVLRMTLDPLEVVLLPL